MDDTTEDTETDICVNVYNFDTRDSNSSPGVQAVRPATPQRKRKRHRAEMTAPPRPTSGARLRWAGPCSLRLRTAPPPLTPAGGNGCK